jgi:aryl-alcohol dehydrogenase-like predicted oxidoreductase
MDASMMKAGGGLGKGQVRAKVEQSLKSMKRDTVDLLYLHAPDPDTREPPSLSLHVCSPLPHSAPLGLNRLV